MSILDTFYILFDSDASKLDKGLNESEKKAEGLVDKLKAVDAAGGKAGAALYDMAGKAAGLLGLGLSIGALVAGVRATAAAYDDLGKLAARFRSTTDAVDEFRDAAGLLGIEEGQSVGALTALDVAIQDTFLGMGRAKKVFEEIGVTVTDAAGKIKPTTQVMSELAEKLHGMERGTQIRIMERLGLDPSLLKLFNADFAALQKRMAEVDKASGFNLDQAVKRSAEYIKATKGLTLEVNTLKMYLEKLGEGFKVAMLPGFTEGVQTATRYVKMFVDFLLKHNKLVEGALVAIGSAILYFLVPAAVKGAIAVWAMIAPFALIGAAVLAVAAAFALLYEDIMVFMEGGDSMIGHIIAKWPVVGEIVKAIGAELTFLWDIAKAFFTFMTTAWDAPGGGFAAFKGAVSAGLNKLLATFPGLKEVIRDITGAFTSAADTVRGAWDAIIATIKAVVSAVSGGLEAIFKAKSLFGFGDTPAKLGAARPAMPPETQGAMARGREYLGAATAAPLAAQTSTSISNVRAGNRTTQVTVGKVEVKTAATDAEGISKSIGGSLRAQMQQAASNYDDGVLA